MKRQCDQTLGVPSLMYPGVHTVTPPPASGVGPYVDMGQCLALPEDVTDPLLRRWSKRLVIPSDSKKINSSRLHDDSAAWRGEDGRWVIGYGHTASAREGLTIAEADAELLLQYDLLPFWHWTDQPRY